MHRAQRSKALLGDLVERNPRAFAQVNELESERLFEALLHNVGNQVKEH